MIERSGIPFSTLRATQFFSLVHLVAQSLSRWPIVPLPKRMRVQPVAAEEVDDRLVQLAEGAPAGYVPEFGGPRVYGTHDLMRAYLRSAGRRRWLVSVGIPGRAAKAVLHDAIIAEGADRGTRTWEEYLQSRRPVAAEASSLSPRP